MKNDNHDSRSEPFLSRDGSPLSGTTVQNTIYGGAVISATALVFQLGSPLSSGPIAPIPVNYLLVFSLILGLSWRSTCKKTDHILAISLTFASALHLSIAGELWAHPNPNSLASLWAASLSSTWFQVPLIGLAHGFAMVCLGWLCTHLLLIIGGKDAVRVVHVSALLVGFVITALGVHALMGYVGGTTFLAPG